MTFAQAITKCPHRDQCHLIQSLGQYLDTARPQLLQLNVIFLPLQFSAHFVAGLLQTIWNSCQEDSISVCLDVQLEEL